VLLWSHVLFSQCLFCVFTPSVFCVLTLGVKVEVHTDGIVLPRGNIAQGAMGDMP
jgi:hypothetical protein